MENGDAYALEFRDPRARELALVGGKGASLALLASSGLPIPAGFCITTAAYHAMIGELSLQAEINALGEIEPDDSEALAQQAAAIRERITAHPMPADVRQAIARTHAHVGSEHSYAVRSSATAEDPPRSIFRRSTEYVPELRQPVHRTCGDLPSSRRHQPGIGNDGGGGPADGRT